MEFSLEQRTASLGVGEFAGFVIGPREGSDGPQGLWRAQLGTHWHQQLRTQTTSDTPDAQFEVPIQGKVFHHGWTLTLTGRIDQIVPGTQGPVLREIKTVTRPLPAAPEELRAEYPEYFAQLATYVALTVLAEPSTKAQGELVFVEVDTGLSQSVAFTSADDTIFKVQLERVAEFLDQRLRARERLQALRFSPAFAALRPGQETVQAELSAALAKHPVVLLEAPTGFGKTGVTLECALELLRSGRFERLVYLTSKSTGQLHVAETISRMTTQPNGRAGVKVWQIRNKREHCICATYHCSREVCPHLVDVEGKWARGGLSRFYLFDSEARDIDNLRKAGRAASVCPYEITRAALAFNDVWIGDYNYVFAPSSRGLFENQPGYDPSRTLLVIDEAHNLPSRVADVYSRRFTATQANIVGAELRQTRAPSRLAQAWDQWTHFLTQQNATDSLPLGDEDDARHLIETVASLVGNTPLDSTALGPDVMEQLWTLPTFVEELTQVNVPRLWWSPQPGELNVTCLDAAAAIGSTLRSFGAALLVSATLTPVDTFAADCGLAEAPAPEAEPPAMSPDRLGKLNKRDTRRLYKQLTSGAELLKVDEESARNAPFLVKAHAPWRDGAYDVAIDLRVDTSYQQRTKHLATSAATIESLHAAARGPCAVFFSSYRYAENIQNTLRDQGSLLRVALQPRLPDLAAQTAWVEESLKLADVLFLVLGSSFAEGIDLLGGRISHALVVGPALPEVNPVQKARLAEFSKLGRDEAFRRVYQAPGIQKVNQALGRLVRAPGQRAKVLLHCRRFAEASYARLLAPEYQTTEHLATDQDLARWLAD
ncbi:MAG: helicase C-terminal domain-containing protein [Nibricoccus sp.]